MDEIYEPREDSWLLEKNVKKYAKGKVLDVGTGSGIQARAALSIGCDVTALDINPKAETKDIKFILSDLFENVKKSYDTIIFNPPYLPDDGEKDLALNGGKEGWELTERFLIQSKKHLNAGGFILLLFSSFTKKYMVDSILTKVGYKFKKIDYQKIDFEELYVYKIE